MCCSMGGPVLLKILFHYYHLNVTFSSPNYDFLWLLTQTVKRQEHTSTSLFNFNM